MSINFGAESIFNNGVTWPVSATALDENRALIAYSDWEDGNTYGNGKAVIATISETSITYGSEYMFNGYTLYISCAALDENHVLIAYQDGMTRHGRARIATVTGDSISYGIESPFTSGTEEVYFTSATALDATHALIAYAYDSFYKFGYVSLVTVLDDSYIVFDSEYEFNTDKTYDISINTLDATHAIICYRDHRGASMEYGVAVIASIARSNIICGSEYVFNVPYTHYISASTLDVSHVIISYQDGGYLNMGTSRIATVSGSNISYGSEYIFNYQTTGEISNSAISQNYALIAYTDCGNSDYGSAILAEIYDSEITYGQEYIFNTARASDKPIAIIDDNNALIAYNDYGNSHYGTAIVAEISTVSVSPEIEQEYRFSDSKLSNYPNPFSSSTTIEYSILNKLKAEPIEIRIYNVLGQLVNKIGAMNGNVQIDMSNMPQGIYLYNIVSGNYSIVKKMILIR